MSFTTPWLLLALVALPLLWWLLRVTPPAPRRELFPAVRLLKDLLPTEETPARTPWWLLALRLLAAALVVVGLAGPIVERGSLAVGEGPVLLVLDNGWASASEWSARMAAANAALDRIARAGRRVALFTTAPDASGRPLAIGPPVPVAQARAALALVKPEPWPPARRAAVALLRAWHGKGGAVYVADRLAGADAADDSAFAAALGGLAPLTEIAEPVPATRLVLPPRLENGRLIARVGQLPMPVAETATLLAEAPGGRVLARFDVPIPARAAVAEQAVPLPLQLANRLSALRLAGPPSAAGMVLLDERWRRRPVGLVAVDPANADLPFVGDLYYLKRALAPYAEIREGDLGTLLAQQLAVIVLVDRVLPEGPERDALAEWVRKGGVLLRFAGPLLAAHPDPLLPVPLLAGERTLGGALTWGRPEHLAPFAADSPFAGISVPTDVTVARQVLAEPSIELDQHTWARLDDGTPLVTGTRLGAGRIVLFHVTANALWSNLPLSGLFVAMLRRVVALSAGVEASAGRTVLQPAETVNGFGAMGAPGPAARGLAADRFAATMPSPQHPPGLYGPENGRRALNLTAALPPLRIVPMIAGARTETLSGLSRERQLGPSLLALAAGLFALDLLIALGLRGLLWQARRAAAVLLLAAIGLSVAGLGSGARAEVAPAAALTTELAYVETGNAAVDGLSRAGLQGLSDFVNAHTAVTLGPPRAVTPGRDDLSLYPLLYWPISTSAVAMSPQAVSALNRFMGNGGIILMDTQGGDADAAGSGAGFAPGTAAALKRVTAGLAIPPLATLTYENLLAHTFYLLRDFPGRFMGAPVWLARDPADRNDNVSPVIIGANDWAAAWATDTNGNHSYSMIPDGERQRLLAYRFGVNVVMYALTGNYKGDQVHLPAILERLGQ